MQVWLALGTLFLCVIAIVRCLLGEALSDAALQLGLCLPVCLNITPDGVVSTIGELLPWGLSVL